MKILSIENKIWIVSNLVVKINISTFISGTFFSGENVTVDHVSVTTSLQVALHLIDAPTRFFH